jgi:hypothetical protein
LVMIPEIDFDFKKIHEETHIWSAVACHRSFSGSLLPPESINCQDTKNAKEVKGETAYSPQRHREHGGCTEKSYICVICEICG